MTYPKKLTVLAGLAALSGCSSGGGMSGGSTTPPPPPPPTTFSAAPVGTAFALTAHQGVEAFDVRRSRMSPLENGTLIANPTARVTLTGTGITLLMPTGDSADFNLSPGSPHLIAPNTYKTTVTGKDTLPVTFISPPRLTAAAYGVWDEGVSVTSTIYIDNMGVVAYGLQTTQMPTSGSATFTGTTAGLYFTGGSQGTFSGNATLVADFAKGAIGGLMSNLQATQQGILLGRLSDINLSGGMIAGAGFMGNAAAGGNASDPVLFDLTGATGTFGGQFDGTAAAEIDGTYVLSNDRASVSVAGAFAAAGQTTAPGQPAPAVPASPSAAQNLGNAPAGTAFSLAAHKEVEAFNANHPIMFPTDRASFMANPTARITLTDKGFSFLVPTGDTATFDISLGSPQLTAPNTYKAAVPGKTSFTDNGPLYVTFVAGARLNYSTYGTWDETSTGGPINNYAYNAGVLAYGLQTAQMPATGSATFTGTTAGRYYAANSAGTFTGSATLVADFSSGSIGGLMSNLQAVSNRGGGSVGRLNDINLTGGTIAGASFSGIAAAGGTASTPGLDITGATGTFGGQFDGPNAAELDGTYALSLSHATVSLAGAFAATGAVTPAGLPTPAVPSSPLPPPEVVPALSAVPAGTPLTNRLASLGWNNNPIYEGGGESSPMTTTSTGFTFQDNHQQQVTFDTRAGSPDVISPGVYFAKVQQNPYVGQTGAPASYIQMALTSLTYSSYGIWATNVNGSSAAAQPELNPSTVAAGAVIFGVATPASQVPSTGTATYTGGFRGSYAIASTSGAGTLGAITGGAVTLNADFAASAITGSITNVTTLSGGVAGRIADIALTQGFIGATAAAGNSFSGQANLMAPTAATTVDLGPGSGNFEGVFFGPNAAEAGGVVHWSAFHAAAPYNVLQGAFGTKK